MNGGINVIINRRRGITMIILSAFCFAMMNVFIKLSGDLPVLQKSFFRNFVALLIALVVMKQEKVGFKVPKESRGWLFLRAFFGTIGLIANYYAVDHLVLTDASMIQKLTPFFSMLASLWILKEKPARYQWFAMFFALIGMIFVVKPSFHNAQLFASLIALIGSFCAALAYTFVRRLSFTPIKSASIVFYFSLFSCVSVIPSMIMDFHVMSITQLMYLLIAGLMAAGGQFSVTAAYQAAPAKDISIFDYSQVLFVGIFGYLLYQQVPDSLSLIGYLIIFVTAYTMYYIGKRKNLSKKNG